VPGARAGRVTPSLFGYHAPLATSTAVSYRILERMKPPPFEYRDPRTLEEAVEALRDCPGEAKILAGGQSLLPMLNMRLARPDLLVDLGRIASLDFIREERGTLAIGAMTSKRAVERSELVERRQPLLRAATLLIAHPQIRNRGTVGGSLAQADPASEYPAVAIALDAELRAVGPEGERAIPARDFFVTYLTTALSPQEVLTEIRLPALPERTGWAVQEVARRHGDYAMVGIAARVALDGRGRCAEARLVLFGVGATPVRASAAEDLLAGEAPGEALFARAARAVVESLEQPLSDVHASADYRRQLAAVLTRRALAEACARAA
jgi:carbon-monoxide dehydrogenase medium subunit